MKQVNAVEPLNQSDHHKQQIVRGSH